MNHLFTIWLPGAAVEDVLSQSSLRAVSSSLSFTRTNILRGSGKQKR
jgi:hypothetical protein